MRAETASLLAETDVSLEELRLLARNVSAGVRGPLPVGVAGAARRGKSALIAYLNTCDGWPLPLTWVELPGYGGLTATGDPQPQPSRRTLLEETGVGDLALALFVSMADPPLNSDDQEALASFAEAGIPVMFVQTKTDVADPALYPDNALEHAALESDNALICRISIQARAGLDDLTETLHRQPWSQYAAALSTRHRERVRATITEAHREFRTAWDRLAVQERLSHKAEASLQGYLHQMTIWIAAQEESFSQAAQVEITRAVRSSSAYILRSREGLLLIYDILRQRAAALARDFSGRVAEFESSMRDISEYFEPPFPQAMLSTAAQFDPPDPAEGRLLVRVADRERQSTLYLQMAVQIIEDYGRILADALRQVLQRHAELIAAYLRTIGDFRDDMQQMAERDVLFMELIERLQTSP